MNALLVAAVVNGTSLLCHAEIVGGGGGCESRGRCWRGSQWRCSVVASVIPRARGRLRSGLADGQAVCLGLCSL